MAKGFKVKAKLPETEIKDTTNCPFPTVAEAWDWVNIPGHPQGGQFTYEKIKKRMQHKRIVIMLPGRSCSYVFLKNFVQMAFELVQNNVNIQISQDYSSMVNFARCKCLGANVLRGPDQKPFDGVLPYDYQLWIDNDIVFNSGNFWQLCDLAFPEDAIMYEDEEKTKPVLYEEYRDPKTNRIVESGGNLVSQSLAVNPERGKKIVAGWYCTEDGKTTSVAHWLEEDDFRANSGVMNHETVDSMAKRRSPFTVDYTGFGWVMVQYGVFENMKYPWFAPKMQVFESGAVQDMCGEDVSFCLDAKEMGIEVWCDPKIRVLHEKTRFI